MHPNGHCVRLPSGSELFFTLPIDLDTQRPMPPQDLEALAAYLERTQLHLSEGPDDPIYQNSLAVRGLISDWLQGSQYLDDMEMYAWESGHGFPTFDDEFGLPVDFEWLWDVIDFEGGEELVGRYVEYINDSAELYAQGHAEEHHDSAPTGRTPHGSDTPSSNSPVEQSQQQHFGRFRVGPGQIQASPADHRCSHMVIYREDLQPAQTHTYTANPPSRNVIIHQEDQGSKPIVFFQENPAKQGKQPRQEQKLSFKRVGSPPKQTVAAELDPFRFYGREPAHEARNETTKTHSKARATLDTLMDIHPSSRPAWLSHSVAWDELDPFRFYGRGLDHATRNKIIDDQNLPDEYQNLADEYYQASRKLPAWESREPLKKAYVREVEAALERARENLENAAHANRSKNKKNAAYSAEDQKLLDILAQSTKAAQQPSSSSRPLFPPPVVNPSKKTTRIFIPKTARSIATNPPRTTLAAKPDTHRNLSFQEPTRLPMRPKEAARSSSYETGVEDSTHRVCGITPHQAHAEDSPDDSTESSPRPAPGGSWMDVFEELMS
ncbi:uncharacterized protein J4E88_006898 [Alternaria novae-zelandiae]|uniref:uncharacterized protein n=1 Tax=Alternaria novae-zelandiae TaxID=430562 RepID=UPI0020C5109E|nr:uncharacterized protein J4E88_006898 [Alternaria novae-zelandiae]KAI4677091.1 hypothetical protein J4E88_006898 [Alternaria novae-zelandiae]